MTKLQRLLFLSVLTAEIFRTEISNAAGTVTVATDAALRTAMSGGGLVTLAFNGTIPLTNTITVSTNTILDASGHTVIISGENTNRIFIVQSNVTFSITNLAMVNGRSANGGAIFNNSGSVELSNCSFTNNQAVGNPGTEPNCEGCIHFFGGQPGGDGMGGAIYNLGRLKVANSIFSSNTARGGNGNFGASGPVHIASNGFPGGTGGRGKGGAIFNGGYASFVDSSLFYNNAFGGNGGSGGNGGFVFAPGSGGGGGFGGDSQGGGIFNSGLLTMTKCTVAENHSLGGMGGTGGTAFDGENIAAGGNGGQSKGGGVYSSGEQYAQNSTFFANQSAGGNGNTGGTGGTGGNGLGGAIVSTNHASITYCTFAQNDVFYGMGGNGTVVGTNGVSQAGAILRENGTNGWFFIRGSILAYSPNGGNCAGVLTDKGYNISSDGSCNFTNVGSLNNTDPKLGPLADNGGPTLTIALLSGSPAIDATTNSLPATDQRGVSRPQGNAGDIGAFEVIAAPDSIAGKTLLMNINSGSGAYKTNGSSHFSASPTGNTFNGGVYTFNKTGDATGTIEFSLTPSTVSGTIGLTFGLTNYFTATLTSGSSGTQTGDFVFLTPAFDQYRIDFLWHHTNGTLASWVMQNGTNFFGSFPLQKGEPVNPKSGWRIVGLNDFNQDLYQDILWQHTDGSLAIWTMVGPLLLNSKVLSPNPGPLWKFAALGDFNGDGRNDFLWKNSNGQVAVWFMDGARYLNSMILDVGTVAAEWKVAGIADFNGDFEDDILWRSTKGTVAVWFMTHTKLTGSTYLNGGQPVVSSWQVAGMSDFNDDGQKDILWQNTNGQQAVWLMKGTVLKHSFYLRDGAKVDPAWQIKAIR